MLEALYDKTCLAKCSGNSLEMHFEYLNIYVAQKLSCEVLAVISCYSLRDCQNLMLEALYDKICLPKCAGISLEINFEYLRISVAQKLTELLYFGSHLWKSYFFLETRFFGQLILASLFFCQIIYFDKYYIFDMGSKLLAWPLIILLRFGENLPTKPIN